MTDNLHFICIKSTWSIVKPNYKETILLRIIHDLSIITYVIIQNHIQGNRTPDYDLCSYKQGQKHKNLDKFWKQMRWKY